MSDPLDDRSTDEATPAEVETATPPAPASNFGLHDSGWTSDEWFQLIDSFVKSGIAGWKDIAALVLGHLNPSQVGTSLASSEGFKRRYGKGHTMQIVLRWAYEQTGKCADCGSRLELQADHIKGREAYPDDPLEADFIENMTLRCRRCNVIRRPSHEFGGLTFLTTEAALMWILLVIRPRTLRDYIRMCRLYGMTMADIRMQEAWSMAHWLARSDPPAYGIEDDEASRYNLLLWPDGALTRTDPDGPIPEGVQLLYSGVQGSSILTFVVENAGRLSIFEYPIGFIPFSTYELGKRPPQSLCITYRGPDRENGLPQTLVNLAPRGATLIAHAVRAPEQSVQVASRQHANLKETLGAGSTAGRLLRTRIPKNDLDLVVL